MSLRSQLILIFALVAGCLFAILFRMVFYDKPSEGANFTVVGQKPPVPVIVADDDLEIGDELNAQNVRFRAFPEDMVAWDAITHFKDVKQRRLVRPVQKGHLISLLDLNDPESDDGKETIFIPPGYQPVPIEISFPFVKSSETLSIVMEKFRVQERVTLSIVFEDIQGNITVDGRPAQRKLMMSPVCEDVEIYQVAIVQRRENSDSEMQKVLVVTVLLNQDQMAQVFAAIKTGNLVIVPQAFPESNYDAAAISGLEIPALPQPSDSSSPAEPEPEPSSVFSTETGTSQVSASDSFVQVSSSVEVSGSSHSTDDCVAETPVENSSPRSIPGGVFCPSSFRNQNLDTYESISEGDSEKESKPIYASSKPLMGAPRRYVEDPVSSVLSQDEASVRPVGLLRNADGTCYTAEAVSSSPNVQKKEVKATPRGVFAPRSSVNWRDYVVNDR